MALVTTSALVEIVVMVNHASHASRVTLTRVAAVAAGWRRQAVHAVTAKLTNSRMSNPTQVTFQWFVTYRSGRVVASMKIHGTMARLAAMGKTTAQTWRRCPGGGTAVVASTGTAGRCTRVPRGRASGGSSRVAGRYPAI